MRISITKDHIGKIVYGYPTGNNARRGVKVQAPTEFKVVGFGRKYAKVIRAGSNYESSIDPTTGASQQAVSSGYGVNAGYMFFLTMESLEEYIRADELRRDVASALNFSSIGKLSDDLVVEIAIQLGLRNSDKDGDNQCQKS